MNNPDNPYTPGDESQWQEKTVVVTARWYGHINFIMGTCVGFFIGSIFTWVVTHI